MVVMHPWAVLMHVFSRMDGGMTEFVCTLNMSIDTQRPGLKTSSCPGAVPGEWPVHRLLGLGRGELRESGFSGISSQNSGFPGISVGSNSRLSLFWSLFQSPKAC